MKLFSKAAKAPKAPPREDTWVPTICGMCINTCHVRARKVDGKVVYIQGNPESPLVEGKICPKGIAGVMSLYDPSRLKYPMKRTNPKKGRDEDPGWVRIDWDEAMDIVTGKLKEAMEYDPRSILIAPGHGQRLAAYKGGVAFSIAMGCIGFVGGGGRQCGNAKHMLANLQHGTGWAFPDWEHCKYLLVFGSQIGGGSHWANVSHMHAVAAARARGMRVVAIDPFRYGLAEKADEWIPIRPGTDGMLAMAMLNLLINRYDKVDRAYLAQHTNGPYLVKDDGEYLLAADGKALVWDRADGCAKAWDDASIKDAAVEGAYTVNGVACKPSFQLMKEHVSTYTPEEAEKVTTVPAATIERIAKEFGDAAMIGSTITLDGIELPHRPVCVNYSRGSQGHKHAYLTTHAMEMLNQVVGACKVPGGSCDVGKSMGHPATGLPAWEGAMGPQGLLVASRAAFLPTLWPPPPITWPPVSADGKELFPLGITGDATWPLVKHPEHYSRPFKAKVLFTLATSVGMSHHNPKDIEEGMNAIPFHMHYGVHLDETAHMADLVLPDASYLETLDLPGTPYDLSWYFNQPHMKEWVHAIRQPVIPPQFERKPMMEFLLELADRLDLRMQFYNVLNYIYGVNALDGSKKYTLEEICDAFWKAYLGPDKGLEYMKRVGVEKYPKSVQERYWGNFAHVRIPIYFEWFPKVGRELNKAMDDHHVPHDARPDTEDYVPMPEWKPCPAYEEPRKEFDLYFITYKHTLMMGSSSMTYNNAWLDEIAEQHDPYCHYMTISHKVGREKGLKDGDWVWVEGAATGNRVMARVRLSSCIHPEVVATANNGGHWAKGTPLASGKGKGVNWQWMLGENMKQTRCGVTANPDLCAKVKITKAEVEGGMA